EQLGAVPSDRQVHLDVAGVATLAGDRGDVGAAARAATRRTMLARTSSDRRRGNNADGECVANEFHRVTSKRVWPCVASPPGGTGDTLRVGPCTKAAPSEANCGICRRSPHDGPWIVFGGTERTIRNPEGSLRIPVAARVGDRRPFCAVGPPALRRARRSWP